MKQNSAIKRLDWVAARSIPIRVAANGLNVVLSQMRQQRCPFTDHPDDTPSFSLDTDKNLFFCFGCGRGGSTIEFVSTIRGCTKREACVWLLGFSPTAMVTLLPREVRKPKATSVNAEPDPDIYGSLLAMSPLEETGRSYLERRCISRSTAAAFRIGQITDSDKTVRQLCKAYGVKRLTASGVLNARGGLCFPEGALLFGYFLDTLLLSLQSRRILPGDPRWMGLTGIAKIPFNLDQIDAASTIYLVEGAMDVLSAYELGHVAIGIPGSTSSLSDTVCNKLRHKTVYIIPDGDDAGTRFQTRLRDQLLEWGTEVAIQTLPAGKDLNDYLVSQRA